MVRIKLKTLAIQNTQGVKWRSVAIDGMTNCKSLFVERIPQESILSVPLLMAKERCG
jgi:hypothetical protein